MSDAPRRRIRITIECNDPKDAKRTLEATAEAMHIDDFDGVDVNVTMGAQQPQLMRPLANEQLETEVRVRVGDHLPAR